MYRRQGSRPFPRKRNAKTQNGCLRRLTNSCGKKRSDRQRRKGKIYPFECRVLKSNRRDEKPFLSDQCKEIEGNNRMGKTRDLFKKIRIFHAKRSTIKDRHDMDLTEAEDIKETRIHRRTKEKRLS